MATYTPNFNLKKPDDADFFSRLDQNGNMDIIDAALKVLQPKIGTLQRTARKDLGASWLLCNGAEVLAANYPDLFNVLKPISPDTVKAKIKNWGSWQIATVCKILPDGKSVVMGYVQSGYPNTSYPKVSWLQNGVLQNTYTGSNYGYPRSAGGVLNGKCFLAGGDTYFVWWNTDASTYTVYSLSFTPDKAGAFGGYAFLIPSGSRTVYYNNDVSSSGTWNSFSLPATLYQYIQPCGFANGYYIFQGQTNPMQFAFSTSVASGYTQVTTNIPTNNIGQDVFWDSDASKYVVVTTDQKIWHSSTLNNTTWTKWDAPSNGYLVKVGTRYFLMTTGTTNYYTDTFGGSWTSFVTTVAPSQGLSYGHNDAQVINDNSGFNFISSGGAAAYIPVCLPELTVSGAYEYIKALEG